MKLPRTRKAMLEEADRQAARFAKRLRAAVRDKPLEQIEQGLWSRDTVEMVMLKEARLLHYDWNDPDYLGLHV